MNPTPSSRDPSGVSSLPPEVRARGRRLAIASHQGGMTHRFAYTDELPTLVLVELGASEALIGLQRAFNPLGQLLQFPTLRAVGLFRKRSILMTGQGLAILAGLPLVAFGALAAAGPDLAVPLVLGSLALTAIGFVISQTVWFPLLRGYTEPHRVGAFFGLLRTTWHLTLIAFFLGSQRWLAAHPGSFGLLFALATLAGVIRLVLVTRLPEGEGESSAQPPRGRPSSTSASSPSRARRA